MPLHFSGDHPRHLFFFPSRPFRSVGYSDQDLHNPVPPGLTGLAGSTSFGQSVACSPAGRSAVTQRADAQERGANKNEVKLQERAASATIADDELETGPGGPPRALSTRQRDESRVSRKEIRTHAETERTASRGQCKPARHVGRRVTRAREQLRNQNDTAQVRMPWETFLVYNQPADSRRRPSVFELV